MAVFQNDKAEILHLECTLYRDPCEEGFTRLCHGWHPSYVRGGSGTWYYKGDRQEAQKLVDAAHAEGKKLAEAYYSQLWV